MSSKVVIGGGLGGLSAVHYLLKKFPSAPVTLLESTDRLGGWIRTHTLPDGTLFEQGPRTIRPAGEAGANALELVQELGLEERIIPIKSDHVAAKNRMIYAQGKLHMLPSSLFGLLKRQEPFTKPLIVQLLRDLTAPRKLVQDESLYTFTERRFGREVADYLISPMCCGICAGNAKEISVNFLMKTLFEYEQKYGSVTRGFLQNLAQSKTHSPKGLALKAREAKWSIYSFDSGCETLVKSLASSLQQKNSNILLNTNCQEISFGKDHSSIVLSNGQTIECNHVISSIPAASLDKLVQKQHPELSDLLRKLNSTVSVAVINLKFARKLDINEAFGLLVAPSEKLPILGVIYDSCCFYNPHTVLTVMMGGHWFEEYFGRNPSESTLLDIALQNLNKILGIQEKPENFKVNILHNCIPQYVIGHDRNLEMIEDYLKVNKLPLSLCGNSYRGVGINDVILSAKTAVNKLVS